MVTKIKYIEKVNYEKMCEVANCCNLPFNSDKNITTTYYKNYLNSCDKSGIRKTEYYKKYKDYGRLWVKNGGIQQFSKKIRGYVLDNKYIDIDIVNCHPNILKNLFKKHNIYDKFLFNYCDRKNDMIEKHGLKNKDCMFAIMYNEELLPKYQTPEIIDFHKKIFKDLWPMIYKSNRAFYNSLKKLINKGKNIHGSLFSHYLQNIESEILELILDYLVENHHIENPILMFDGLMVEKKYNIIEDDLRKIENYVYDNSGYDICLKFKSTDTDWKPIPIEYPFDDSEDVDEMDISGVLDDNYSVAISRNLFDDAHYIDDKGKKVVDEVKLELFVKYMNNYFCKFNDPCCYGYRLNVRDVYTFRKCTDITHITCSYPSYPLYSVWSTHLNTKCYDKQDFYINKDNEDKIKEYYEDIGKLKGNRIYNLYTRPYSRKPDGDVEELIKPFFDFIYEVISNRNANFNKFILDWIAYILQYGKTGIAVILMGSKGTGKGTFKELLIDIITQMYSYVDTTGSRIGSRFNSYEDGKLLGVFEEVLNNNGEMIQRHEIMKSKITDKQQMSEKKGFDVVNMTNNCNYMFITNGLNPVKIENDERRYVATIVSNERMKDYDYFKNLRKIVKKYVPELRYYFEHRQVERKDMVVIHTEANDRLLYLNTYNHENFLKYEMPLLFNKQDRITSSDLYDMYLNYCFENPETKKPMQKKYFLMYITNNTDYMKVQIGHKKQYIRKIR